MEVINIFLVFVNMLMFTCILWLRHNKAKRLEDLKESYRMQQVRFQAKLDAQVHASRKGK